MTKHIILVRQSSALRQIGEDEIVAALTDPEQKLGRTILDVATAQFADAIGQGDWAGQGHNMREHAAKIRAEADRRGDAAVHYFGLAEIPHAIALGAHVGDERTVQVHDHDRGTGTWTWPDARPTIELKTIGTQDLKATVTARGPAVLRVAISAVIADAGVRTAVGDETVADVTITHANAAATVGLVRSAADVELVREAFRAAYSALRNARPGIETIHLLVAAPPSVCFAIGQELSLRNASPIQTYRYRSADGIVPAQQPAILLSSTGGRLPVVPLTDEELAVAARVRNEVWPAALRDVETYALKKQTGKDPGLWYGDLVHKEALCRASPFRTLPSVARLLPRGVGVDPKPFAWEFAFDETAQRWQLNDRLLVGVHRAARGDDDRLRQLIRLFLLHEYLHLFHSISRYTASEVGKFANCLEHIDYTADAYALLHQLDLTHGTDSALAEFDPMRRFLVDQIELAIQSFWAFDADSGNEWEVRRMRRYLNWYWRQAQIERAANADAVMTLFARQPRLEVGGLYQVARGRRVIAFLDKTDATTFLEIAIVMEDERLFRQSDGPNTKLRELLVSFRTGQHERIKEFFRSVYDTARGHGSVVQPAVAATK